MCPLPFGSSSSTLKADGTFLLKYQLSLNDHRAMTSSLTPSLTMNIVPLIRSKCGLDLGYSVGYSSVCLLNELTRELAALLEYLKKNELRPLLEKVLSLWSGHVPFLDVRRLLTDAPYRKSIFAKLLLNVRLIAITLQLALAVVFVYQCTQLWAIRGSVQEAMAFVDDEEVRLEFALVEHNVQQLKDISEEIHRLVGEYGAARQSKEKSQLLERIHSKLSSVDKFQGTCDMMNHLQRKLSTQQRLLNQCESRFNQTGLTSLSASGIGLHTLLIRDKLSDLERNLSHLTVDCELEFKCTMKEIEQIQERKEELRLEAKRIEAEEEAAKLKANGMIASLVKVADGWRLMATSYVKILN